MNADINGYLDKPIIEEKSYTSSGDTSIFHIDLLEKEQIIIHGFLFIAAVIFLILVYFIIKYFTAGREKPKNKKMIIYSLIAFIISSFLLFVWLALHAPGIQPLL